MLQQVQARPRSQGRCHHPVLVLDFEGGILALMGRPNISVCPVKSGEELLQVVKELQSDTTFKSVVFRRVVNLREAQGSGVALKGEGDLG
jgi:hypothetical protein